MKRLSVIGMFDNIPHDFMHTYSMQHLILAEFNHISHREYLLNGVHQLFEIIEPSDTSTVSSVVKQEFIKWCSRQNVDEIYIFVWGHRQVQQFKWLHAGENDNIPHTYIIDMKNIYKLLFPTRLPPRGIQSLMGRFNIGHLYMVDPRNLRYKFGSYYMLCNTLYDCSHLNDSFASYVSDKGLVSANRFVWPLHL